MNIIKIYAIFKADLIYLKKTPLFKILSYIYAISFYMYEYILGEYVLADILSDRTGQASVHFIDINVYVYLSVFKH